VTTETPARIYEALRFALRCDEPANVWLRFLESVIPQAGIDHMQQLAARYLQYRLAEPPCCDEHPPVDEKVFVNLARPLLPDEGAREFLVECLRTTVTTAIARWSA
jgi:hypothetical protein